MEEREEGEERTMIPREKTSVGRSNSAPVRISGDCKVEKRIGQILWRSAMKKEEKRRTMYPSVPQNEIRRISSSFLAAIRAKPAARRARVLRSASQK